MAQRSSTQSSSILEAQGFSTKISVLHSIGTTSAGNPGMKDDIAGVRAVVEKHIDTNEDDILVLHSSEAQRTQHWQRVIPKSRLSP